MANHSATKKAIRKTITRTAVNKNRKSRIKTYIKKVLLAVESGVAQDANNALIEAQSEIMRGVSANIIKKNTASRKISRLSKKVKDLALGNISGKSTNSEDAHKKLVAKAPSVKKVEEKKTVAKKEKTEDKAAKSATKKKEAASKE